jgi:pyridoxamine 5'-phosphate oxidase
MSEYFAQLREEYKKLTLSKKDLAENPFTQFNKWMDEAIQAHTIMPNAMSLATVGDNEVGLRTVLLKEIKNDSFVFFTNYDSKKAHHIQENNQVALLFAWLELDRQVKISGIAQKISKVESLKYFLTRPIDSQLAAYASQQSKIISSRNILKQEFFKAKENFKNGEVPLPNWGGYAVVPTKIEFWQGRENRLHDRFLYTKITDTSWDITRLQP